MNNHEIIQSFTLAMLNDSVPITDHIIADGNLHRAHVEGDKYGTKNGAYILHIDGKPTGWYMHFRTGIVGRWTLSGRYEPLSNNVRLQIEAEKRRRLLEQQERHHRAAQKARYVWNQATAITEPSQHPYLIKKRVQAHIARLYGNALVVPIYNESFNMINLQFIDTDGNKRFLSGGKKKSGFCWIGKKTGTVLIAEGFATAASLHEDSGYLTIVAFDAGNLVNVATVIKSLFQNADIIICGDNDESGTGQKAAQAAALACGGKYLLPDQVGMDFNDVLTAAVSL